MRRGEPADPECGSDLVDRDFGRVASKPTSATEKTSRIEIAEHEIGVETVAAIRPPP